MFKTLTKTLAITGVILGGVSLPVQSSPRHAALVDTLEAIGVPVYDGANREECQPDEGSYMLGYYHIAGNFIVLCTNNGTESVMAETLTHEAVHVIQDCVGGGIQNSNIVPIGNWSKLVDSLSEKHIRTITELYPKDQWGLEVEARTFQTNPSAVNEGLKKYCF